MKHHEKKAHIKKYRRDLRDNRKLTLALLVRRDGRKCRLCKRELSYEQMTIDHIKPLAKGGKNSPSNLCIMCARCNREKGNWYNSSTLSKKDIADQSALKEQFAMLKSVNKPSLWQRIRSIITR